MSEYSMWVLEYAWVPDAADSFFVYGRHNAGASKLPYCYTLLKGNGQTILLDCGLNNASHGTKFIEKFNVQHWHSPTDVLAAVGTRPEDVDHVILTHAHFDHMGGLELFPNAKFYIQKEELAAWVSIMTLDRRFRFLMQATDTGDMIYAVELARDGRLIGLDGDTDDLFPGIDVRIARDTHTAGSQYVVIRNDGKTESADPFVYTGDLLYCHDNIHGGTPEDPAYSPIGLALGSQTNLIFATHDIMKIVGNEVSRVIAPHEKGLADIYPSRVTDKGLYVVEVALAEGQSSYI